MKRFKKIIASSPDQFPAEYFNEDFWNDLRESTDAEIEECTGMDNWNADDFLQYTRQSNYIRRKVRYLKEMLDEIKAVVSTSVSRFNFVLKELSAIANNVTASNKLTADENAILKQAIEHVSFLADTSNVKHYEFETPECLQTVMRCINQFSNDSIYLQDNNKLYFDSCNWLAQQHSILVSILEKIGNARLVNKEILNATKQRLLHPRQCIVGLRSLFIEIANCLNELVTTPIVTSEELVNINKLIATFRQYESRLGDSTHDQMSEEWDQIAATVSNKYSIDAFSRQSTPPANNRGLSPTSSARQAPSTSYWYHDNDIKTYVECVINSRMGGYKRNHRYLLEGQGFDGKFAEENETNKYYVLVTPAVDRASASAPLCLFLNKHLLAAPDEGRPDHRADVFDEIMPILANQPNGFVKILFPFNLTNEEDAKQNNDRVIGHHWVLGEIKIHKQRNSYKVIMQSHDPYGRDQLTPENIELFSVSISRRLRESVKSSINIRFENIASNYSQRQSFQDSTSCGVIVCEDLLKRITGETLNQTVPYPVGAFDLRSKQLETVKQVLAVNNPTRNKFINDVTNSHLVDDVFHNETNADSKLPTAKTLNEVAAFESIELGNSFLFYVLLGNDITLEEFRSLDAVWQKLVSNTKERLAARFDMIFAIHAIYYLQNAEVPVTETLSFEPNEIAKMFASTDVLVRSDVGMASIPLLLHKAAQRTMVELSIVKHDCQFDAGRGVFLNNAAANQLTREQSYEYLNETFFEKGWKEKIFAELSAAIKICNSPQQLLFHFKQRVIRACKSLEVLKQQKEASQQEMKSLEEKFAIQKKKSLHEYFVDRVLSNMSQDRCPAVYQGKTMTELRREILSGRINPELHDAQGHSLLERAFEKQNYLIVKWLLSRGVKVDSLISSNSSQVMEQYQKTSKEIEEANFDMDKLESRFRTSVEEVLNEYREKAIRWQQILDAINNGASLKAFILNIFYNAEIKRERVHSFRLFESAAKQGNLTFIDDELIELIQKYSKPENVKTGLLGRSSLHDRLWEIVGMIKTDNLFALTKERLLNELNISKVIKELDREYSTVHDEDNVSQKQLSEFITQADLDQQNQNLNNQLNAAISTGVAELAAAQNNERILLQRLSELRERLNINQPSSKSMMLR